MNDLLDKFVERGYKAEYIIDQFNKASIQDRNQLLQYKTKDKNMKIVFVTKYNKNLPSIRKAMETNWELLHINKDIGNYFQDKPVIAFKRNDNLKRLIGQTRISNNKVIRKTSSKMGKSSPCRSRQGNKCCKQMKNTSTFSNRHTKREFKIFHQLNCKSRHLVYLLECIKCNNKAYVGKCETPGNLRINTHRSDSKKPDSIAVDVHFGLPDHDFEKHAKFTFIEKITKKELSELQMTNLLLRREDFWILKLRTLKPDGFNDKLNFTYTNLQVHAMENA